MPIGGPRPLACWSMSFDFYIERYEGQRRVSMPVAAFDEVFRPLLVDAVPEHGYWRVRAPNGSEGTLHATVEPRLFDDIRIDPYDSDVLYLLVEFAKRADAVIYAPVGPTLLVAEEQREQLPPELQAGAIVLRDGDDIEQVIWAGWDEHPE
jgi:hypothetical protein